MRETQGALVGVVSVWTDAAAAPDAGATNPATSASTARTRRRERDRRSIETALGPFRCPLDGPTILARRCARSRRTRSTGRGHFAPSVDRGAAALGAAGLELGGAGLVGAAGAGADLEAGLVDG